MRRFCSSASILLLLAGICIGAGDVGRTTKPLEGVWRLTECVKKGEKVSEETCRSTTLEFSGDMLKLKGQGGFGEREFGFKLDEKQDPHVIELVPLDGKFKGMAVSGIYKSDGDTLTLCLPNDDDAGKPKEFQAPKGSGLILMVLKREER